MYLTLHKSIFNSSDQHLPDVWKSQYSLLVKSYKDLPRSVVQMVEIKKAFKPAKVKRATYSLLGILF